MFGLEKKVKGNIMISFLTALLILTMGLSVCTAVVKDKHTTNLYIDRINARTEINSYVAMSRNFIYSYFSNKAVELEYSQTVERYNAQGEERIVRTLVTNPSYIDIEDLSLALYKGEPKYLMRSDELYDFAGYKFNMKIYLDIPVDEVQDRLRVLSHSEAFNPSFLEDINDTIKSEDAYTVNIKDIPLIVVFEYDTWVQETKVVIAGLRFQRDYFPILRYDLDGSLQGIDGANSSSTATGVVSGHLINDYIRFETIESQRKRGD